MGKSLVWRFFSKGEQVSTCNICNFKTKQCGNTTNMIRHLRDAHLEKYDEVFEAQARSTKQPKIDESFSVIESFKVGDNKKNTDHLLAWFIVKCCLPFNLVESKSFHDFLHSLNSHYIPPKRKKLVNIISDLNKTKRELVTCHLKTIKWFCLTSDSWKDNMNNRSYLGLTLHYIDSYELKSVCIYADEFTESMTSDAIYQRIIGILFEWEIPKQKIVAMVTDGAANFRSVARKFDKNLHCVAHQLNLVAEDSIEADNELISLLNKLRHIITLFRKSKNLIDELRQERENSGKKDLKLIQDVSTRWNSIYLMIDRYLELHREVSLVFTKNTRRSEDLNDDEVKNLEEILKVLEPLYEMTVDISGEKYVTISRVIPLITNATNFLEKIMVTTDIAINLKLNVLNSMAKRFENIEQNELFALSTILDPRFKRLDFRSSSACALNIGKLNKMLSQVPTTQIVPVQTDNSSFWSYHDARASSINDVSSGMHSGLKHYLELPATERNGNPLEFWKKNKSNWPQLHNLAIHFLTVQATSVPCERLFSKTGAIISQKRNRIAPKNVDILSFLDSLPDYFV